ncbi:unnamed protein product, partial [Clonostachys solani]
MAQTSRYSVKSHTPYVGLFDWNYLVLAVTEQASGTNGGAYCWLAVVPERTLMRRALLGFLQIPPSTHQPHQSRTLNQGKLQAGFSTYEQNWQGIMPPKRYRDNEHTSSTVRGSTRYAYEDDFGMEKLSLRDNRHHDRQREYLHEGEYYSTNHLERNRDRRIVAPDFKLRTSSSSSKSSKSGPFGLGPDGLKGRYGSSGYRDYE